MGNYLAQYPGSLCQLKMHTNTGTYIDTLNTLVKYRNKPFTTMRSTDPKLTILHIAFVDLALLQRSGERKGDIGYRSWR